ETRRHIAVVDAAARFDDSAVDDGTISYALADRHRLSDAYERTVPFQHLYRLHVIVAIERARAVHASAHDVIALPYRYATTAGAAHAARRRRGHGSRRNAPRHIGGDLIAARLGVLPYGNQQPARHRVDRGQYFFQIGKIRGVSANDELILHSAD